MEDLVRRPAGGSHPLDDDLEQVLVTMGGLWDELRGARLFITGGTGFVGCWLLETLLWADRRLGLGVSVVVLTRDPAAFRRKVPHLASAQALTLQAGDVRSYSPPDGPFTHVIHAATASGVPVDAPTMFETIVDGTRRTLATAERGGARRLLLVSSGAVYGIQPPDLERMGEDYRGGPDPLEPRHAYGEGKRAAEMLCALYASETLTPVIARPFAFVGPYLPLDAHFAVGNFIRDALHGGPIRVTGDGTPLRSYLYAADLAIWLWTILLRGAPMRPYNVGSEHAVSVADLAHTVAKTNPSLQVEIAGKPDPDKAPERYVPSTRRAQQELGLAEHIGLDDAIARTIAWHSESR